MLLVQPFTGLSLKLGMMQKLFGFHRTLPGWAEISVKRGNVLEKRRLIVRPTHAVLYSANKWLYLEKQLSGQSVRLGKNELPRKRDKFWRKPAVAE